MSEVSQVTRKYCSHATDGVQRNPITPVRDHRGTKVLRSTAWLLGWLAISLVSATAQTVETHAFTNLNRWLPDGNPAGFSDRRIVTSAISSIAKVRVKLQVAGEFNGDLYGYLRCIQGGTTNLSVLLNRPGRATGRLSGYGDAGINVIFDDAAAGDIHTYRTVTNLPAGTSLVGAWRPDARAVDPSAVLDTTPRTSTLGVFNGGSGSAEWTLFLADLESGGTNLLVSWELEVTGAARPPFQWASPSAITYGTLLSGAQLNATSSVPGSYTYNPPLGTRLNAGAGQSLSVTFTPANASQYVAITTNVFLDVLKAPLTVTVASTNKVFGAPLPTFSAVYTGFIGGESVANLSSLATLSTVATPSSPAAGYAITAGGVVASNYAALYVNGTLTVIKAGTTGGLVSSKNPSLPGDAVTFSYSLAAVAPGAGVPTGTVQFKIDGVNAGAPVALAAGVAQLATSSLSAGSHTVVAEYAGDGNFLGATNALAPVQVVNSPPQALADALERGVTNGTKVLVSTLLANDSDPDGEAVAFVSFSATSTNGATLIRDGDWIHYTPAARVALVDAFTYVISDSRGTIAQGTVLVTVRNDTLPSQNLVITDRGDGSYLIRFDGIPGITYRIEWNDNVELPLWQSLGSATANAFGVFQYIDTPPVGAPRRYYRSVFP